MRAFGIKPAWLTLKRSLVILYNDVYDEHLFVLPPGSHTISCSPYFRYW